MNLFLTQLAKTTALSILIAVSYSSAVLALEKWNCNNDKDKYYIDFYLVDKCTAYVYKFDGPSHAHKIDSHCTPSKTPTDDFVKITWENNACTWKRSVNSEGNFSWVSPCTEMSMSCTRQES